MNSNENLQYNSKQYLHFRRYQNENEQNNLDKSQKSQILSRSGSMGFYTQEKFNLNQSNKGIKNDMLRTSMNDLNKRKLQPLNTSQNNKLYQTASQKNFSNIAKTTIRKQNFNQTSFFTNTKQKQQLDPKRSTFYSHKNIFTINDYKNLCDANLEFENEDEQFQKTKAKLIQYFKSRLNKYYYNNKVGFISNQKNGTKFMGKSQQSNFNQASKRSNSQGQYDSFLMSNEMEYMQYKHRKQAFNIGLNRFSYQKQIGDISQSENDFEINLHLQGENGENYGQMKQMLKHQDLQDFLIRKFEPFVNENKNKNQYGDTLERITNEYAKILENLKQNKIYKIQVPQNWKIRNQNYNEFYSQNNFIKKQSINIFESIFSDEYLYQHKKLNEWKMPVFEKQNNSNNKKLYQDTKPISEVDENDQSPQKKKQKQFSKTQMTDDEDSDQQGQLLDQEYLSSLADLDQQNKKKVKKTKKTKRKKRGSKDFSKNQLEIPANIEEKEQSISSENEKTEIKSKRASKNKIKNNSRKSRQNIGNQEELDKKNEDQNKSQQSDENDDDLEQRQKYRIQQKFATGKNAQEPRNINIRRQFGQRQGTRHMTGESRVFSNNNNSNIEDSIQQIQNSQFQTKQQNDSVNQSLGFSDSQSKKLENDNENDNFVFYQDMDVQVQEDSDGNLVSDNQFPKYQNQNQNNDNKNSDQNFNKGFYNQDINKMFTFRLDTENINKQEQGNDTNNQKYIQRQNSENSNKYHFQRQSTKKDTQVQNSACQTDRTGGIKSQIVNSQELVENKQIQQQQQHINQYNQNENQQLNLNNDIKGSNELQTQTRQTQSNTKQSQQSHQQNQQEKHENKETTEKSEKSYNNEINEKLEKNKKSEQQEKQRLVHQKSQSKNKKARFLKSKIIDELIEVDGDIDRFNLQVYKKAYNYPGVPKHLKFDSQEKEQCFGKLFQWFYEVNQDLEQKFIERQLSQKVYFSSSNQNSNQQSPREFDYFGNNSQLQQQYQQEQEEIQQYQNDQMQSSSDSSENDDNVSDNQDDKSDISN